MFFRNGAFFNLFGKLGNPIIVYDSNLRCRIVSQDIILVQPSSRFNKLTICSSRYCGHFRLIIKRLSANLAAIAVSSFFYAGQTAGSIDTRVFFTVVFGSGDNSLVSSRDRLAGQLMIVPNVSYVLVVSVGVGKFISVFDIFNESRHIVLVIFFRAVCARIDFFTFLLANQCIAESHVGFGCVCVFGRSNQSFFDNRLSNGVNNEVLSVGSMSVFGSSTTFCQNIFLSQSICASVAAEHELLFCVVHIEDVAKFGCVECGNAVCIGIDGKRTFLVSLSVKRQAFVTGVQGHLMGELRLNCGSVTCFVSAAFAFINGVTFVVAGSCMNYGRNREYMAESCLRAVLITLFAVVALLYYVAHFGAGNCGNGIIIVLSAVGLIFSIQFGIFHFDLSKQSVQSFIACRSSIGNGIAVGRKSQHSLIYITASFAGFGDKAGLVAVGLLYNHLFAKGMFTVFAQLGQNGDYLFAAHRAFFKTFARGGAGSSNFGKRNHRVSGSFHNIYFVYISTVDAGVSGISVRRAGNSNGFGGVITICMYACSGSYFLMAVAAYSTFFDENTGGNAGSVALGYGFICVGSKIARKVMGYGVSAVIAGVYLVSAFKTSSRNVGGSEDVINLVDNFHMFFAAFFADFYLHTGFGTSSRDFAGSNIFMFTSCGSSFFANRIMALGAGL